MSNRGRLIRSRNKLQAALGSREPKRPIFRALTGDGTGGDTRTHVRVDDEPTRMFVRADGRGVLQAVVATNVPMRHDVPVYVGPTQENPDVYEILGIDFGEMTNPGGYSYVPTHHESHEFRVSSGGDDVVWVNKSQFLPFLGAPNDPADTEVYVYAGFYLYLADWQYFPGGLSGDLTTYNPGVNLAKYILISINAQTNVLAITDGVEFAPSPPSNPSTNIPQCPSSHFPIVAVYLLNTTATITWDELYDVRLMVGGGVNTEVPGPHHFIDRVVHDETTAHTVPTEGDMIYADSVPEWNVLTVGGNHEIIKSTTAGGLQYPAWTAFNWNEINSAAGANMVHTHLTNALGGSTLEPNRLRLQDNAYQCNQFGTFTGPVPWQSYRPLYDPDVVTGTIVTGFQGSGVNYGSIMIVQAEYDLFAVGPNSTRLAHRFYGDQRDIVPAADDTVFLGKHPLLFIRSWVDNKWYEIGWSGSSGGAGAHNILSNTHGDSLTAAVVRGAMITGQVNHPLATLEWTRLDYPGDRHHLQTDDLDVIWDLDISMEPDHWIGLGDATGYGAGLGRIKFILSDPGLDIIANLDADVGVGTESPNIAGEAVGLTIESATGAPTLELSRLDDFLPADAMIGVIRWFSGNNTQCAQAQIDVVQSGWYENEATMEFWVADDCALCHVMNLMCDEVIIFGSIGVDDVAPITLLHLNFETSGANYTHSTATGSVFLESNPDAGNGNFGAGIIFGEPAGTGSAQEGASIYAIQTGNDNDRVGLGFAVHGAASSDPRFEAMRIDHAGRVGINTTSPNAVLDVEGDAFFGNYDAGNYSEFETDGTLEFVGNATVWEDLRVSLERGRISGGTVPNWQQFKDNGAASVGVYAYQFDNGEEIWFSVQMPHSWQEGTTIYPHLHWSPSSDSNPADNVGIGLEYTWADINEDFGNTTIITRDVSTGVNNQDNHLMHDFDAAGIDGTGQTISSVLMCRFFRQAAVADDYPDPIWALEIDFHYEIDTVGSRTITTK